MTDTNTENQSPDIISLSEKIRKDIQHFHAQTGIGYAMIGKRAAKNPRIWSRLEEGGTITLEIADRIYDFMASQGYDYRVQILD